MSALGGARAMLDEAKTWAWLDLGPSPTDEDVLGRLAGRAGVLELSNKTSKRRGEERDQARVAAEEWRTKAAQVTASLAAWEAWAADHEPHSEDCGCPSCAD